MSLRQTYSYIPVWQSPNENKNDFRAKMGQNFEKFSLLMWKNWLLQYRKPIQSIVEITAPVLFSILLVVIRSLVDPELHESVVYNPFCTIPITVQDNNSGLVLCPRTDIPLPANNFSNDGGMALFTNMTMVYSPTNKFFDQAMSFFHLIFENVIGLNDSHCMEDYFITNSSEVVFAGIQFDDRYKDIENFTDIKHLKIFVRFPGETRLTLDPFGINNWRTNLIYPVFQVPGPRMPNSTTGAAPSYFMEGFLAVQHFMTLSLILARNGFSYPLTSNASLIQWLLKNNMPFINMRRFANSEWYEDLLLTALKNMIGLIIMLSFVYTCINTVKAITTEKEKQLKESMKIMGLPSWLHWTAWFVKCFIFLLISIVLMVILLKVRWYTNTNYTVFTHANPLVMLLFLILYICATITFCFAVSVFFSRANTAATVAGLLWFLSYTPYLFMQENYDSLSLSSKLLASLGSNSAMAFGFQVMLMYEGTGEGIQWNNLFTPNSPDDTLTLGLVMFMLLLDTIIYLLLALYFEAIFPGEYGIAQPWYFPFTYNFWCGQPKYIGVTDSTLKDKCMLETEFFEKEPSNLNVGIHIRNLRKIFGTKAAVRNLSINMFEDQITVLLGHNGAGKTTTMSMLTGMYVPTSGTAVINGYDIRTNMQAVRKSLGLCPQHNILFDDLTVREHLYFFTKLKGLNKLGIEEEINKYVGLLQLESKKDVKSSTLSGGMKRKLGVGIALCGNSKVVMLDEPTAGMDPSARRALWDLLQNQKKGRTILLSTHFMDEADLLGDRIAIMAWGDLQCCGSSFFLKKKYGAGYSLIMDKSTNCDPSQVTHLLRKYIPNAEIYGNVGSELSYLLTENQSYVFEPMLKDLEDNSESMGIRSYGISLTTLEEVFMKVGADHEQEDKGEKEFMNGDIHSTNDPDLSNNTRMNLDLSPNEANGFALLFNQFLAMLMKKFLSVTRSWILLVVQVAMPTLFLIIAIIVTRNRKRTGNLPMMPLDLDKFSEPVTLVEDNSTFSFHDMYQKSMKESHYTTKTSENMISEMISLTKTTPITVRRKYIVGASFNDMQVPLIGAVPNITAWFNNDPYHSPGISLGMVLNAVYRKLGNCADYDCSIKFINYPMPYSATTQVKQLLNGQNMGFQLAFNIGFSMAFVSSFYVLFIVRENVCNSKHLQFVSGVKVYIFWIASILADMLTYLITIVVLLITLIIFQEDGFKTSADIERMFLIFFYFGWAFMPMLYISGYFFDVPSTGFTRMTLFSIFTGTAAFLVVQVLSTESLNLEHIGRALHWVFLVIPHYSLASGISESFKVYGYNYICNNLFEVCMQSSLSKEDCWEMISNQKIKEICEEADTNYFKWKAPGIGRNLLYSFTEGLILFTVLLFIEYEVFSKLIYFVSQKYCPKYPKDNPDEDSDVTEEKLKLSDFSESEVKTNYILAVKDLTKYYGKFLAVNGLCLGVKKYECFGLLGVNGAGKTTTFKMLTGDVQISFGDGWVNSFSLKSQLKEVQRFIGYCPQFDALLDDMTARESITMFSLLRGIKLINCNIIAEHLAREFDFVRHLDKKVKELSGGNKRKLSTAISLIGNPPVIYLDEPTTGMDPATKRYLWNAICKIRDNGKCVVLTSHSMEECEALCTRLAIMVNGNFKCLGSTQHLKNKFAEGYTLTIKVKKLSENEGSLEPEIRLIDEFVTKNFPSARLREKHQELMTYYITDKSLLWSKMFGILEQGKRQNCNIEDYSLGQSSLEQVFLTFTKYQY